MHIIICVFTYIYIFIYYSETSIMFTPLEPAQNVFIIEVSEVRGAMEMCLGLFTLERCPQLGGVCSRRFHSIIIITIKTATSYENCTDNIYL